MSAVVVKDDMSRLYVWKGTGEASLADKLGNATEIGEMGGDVEEIDTTNLESEGKESQAGDIDFGELTVTQQITADEYEKAHDWMVANDSLKFGIVIDDKTGTPVYTLTGDCWIKSVKRSAISRNGILTVSITLRITGIPTTTWTEPAA